MKLPNHGPHDHSEQNNERHWSKKIKQYWRNMYRSKKCMSMSHGSYDIVRSMSWAKGENWRRCHPKSLNKHHK
jgi:hypothetical protein